MPGPHGPKQPPLPACDGPKLPPFNDGARADDVEFVRSLSLGSDNQHSYVWQVLIEGRPYALKMFKFTTPWDLWPVVDVNGPEGPSWRGHSRADFDSYLDPFCCECRAYGRLREAAREDLAVRAFGYLYLTSAQERQLMKLYGYSRVSKWTLDTEEDGGDSGCSEDGSRGSREAEVESDEEDDDLFDRCEYTLRHPVRAIVKELVEDNRVDAFSVPLTGHGVLQMFLDQAAMNELGVLVRDVHARNYTVSSRTITADALDRSLAAKQEEAAAAAVAPGQLDEEEESQKEPLALVPVRILVDLSSAWTLPHVFLVELPFLEYKEERKRDYVGLMGILDEWNSMVELDEVENHVRGNQLLEFADTPKSMDRYGLWTSKKLGLWPVFPLDRAWHAVVKSLNSRMESEQK